MPLLSGQHLSLEKYRAAPSDTNKTRALKRASKRSYAGKESTAYGEINFSKKETTAGGDYQDPRSGTWNVVTSFVEHAAGVQCSAVETVKANREGHHTRFRGRGREWCQEKTFRGGKTTEARREGGATRRGASKKFLRVNGNELARRRK